MCTGAVILNYNNWQNTVTVAKKINNMKTVNHIAIVDNCSTNNSIEELKHEFSNTIIDIVKTERNGGYAYGNNYGIRYLIDKYNISFVFILNPDVIVNEDCFKEILECFNNNPEYGIIGAVRTDINGKYTQRQFWQLPTFNDELFDCFSILRKYTQRKHLKIIPENCDRLIQVEVVPGCFWGGRTTFLEAVDFLDENTFLFYEENILAQRMKAKGFKEGLATKATVIHAHERKKYIPFKSAIRPLIYTQQSKKYYREKYMNLNRLQMCILDVCYKLAILDFSLRYIVKNVYLTVKRLGIIN